MRRGQVLLVVAALLFLLAVPGARPAAAASVTMIDPPPYTAVGGSFSAAGQLDSTTSPSPTLSADYGDGTPLQPVSLTPSGSSWTFLLSHTYTANGIYSVRLHLVDGVPTDFLIADKDAPPVGAGTGVTVTGIGGGGTGDGGNNFTSPSVTETFSPAQPVWGQDVAFTATITGFPDPHLDWDWEWAFEFSGALTPAGQPTSTVKTITHRYAQPGSKDTSIHAQNLPAGFSTTPIATAHVDVYGRQQYIAIDCGTPTFGLPTTLTATLTDLSPQPSAATLSGRHISFVVNGAVVGTGITGAPTSATTAVATTSVTLTVAPGGTYTCGAAVADNQLFTLFDPTSGAQIPTALVAYTSPPGTSTFPLGTTLSPDGSFTEPGGVVVQPWGNQPAGAPKPLTLLSTPGKVNGEAKNANDGAKVNFEVRAKTGSAVQGHLDYSSPSLKFKAKTFVGLGISADGRTAVFKGTGETDDKTPTTVAFMVRIVDNGLPGKTDGFQISFDGGTTWGTMALGDLHIHPAKQGDPDF